MSVIVLENLIKFIEINADRLGKGESTICKTSEAVTVRDYLPCSNKTDAGEFIIKCEDCPFSSVEASLETKAELEIIIKKQKTKNLLLGLPD